eukprot:213418-Chlamydomonas_euryale.AAC.1
MARRALSPGPAAPLHCLSGTWSHICDRTACSISGHALPVHHTQTRHCAPSSVANCFQWAASLSLSGSRRGKGEREK